MSARVLAIRAGIQVPPSDPPAELVPTFLRLQRHHRNTRAGRPVWVDAYERGRAPGWVHSPSMPDVRCVADVAFYVAAMTAFLPSDDGAESAVSIAMRFRYGYPNDSASVSDLCVIRGRWRI